MPFLLTCSCGQALKVADETTAEKVACPKCRAVISLAEHRKGQKAAPELAEPPAPDDEFLSPVFEERPETIPTVEDEFIEVAPEPEKRTKKQRKIARARRQGLEKLSIGLVLHMVGPFIFLPSMWTGWLALALLMMSLTPDLSSTADAFVHLAITSGIFIILSALAEIPTAIFCMRVPDASARGLLIGSLACRFLGLVFGVMLLFLFNIRAVMLILAFATSIASWVLWMCFLGRIGNYLEKPEFASEVKRTLASGLRTLIATVLFLFMVAGMIMLIVYIKFLFARYALFVTSVSVFLAFVRIALAVGQIESVTTFFLSPTGIPFIFNHHLPLVSSLRVVIERRT